MKILFSLHPVRPFVQVLKAFAPCIILILVTSTQLAFPDDFGRKGNITSDENALKAHQFNLERIEEEGRRIVQKPSAERPAIPLVNDEVLKQTRDFNLQRINEEAQRKKLDERRMPPPLPQGYAAKPAVAPEVLEKARQFNLERINKEVPPADRAVLGQIRRLPPPLPAGFANARPLKGAQAVADAARDPNGVLPILAEPVFLRHGDRENALARGEGPVEQNPDLNAVDGDGCKNEFLKPLIEVENMDPLVVLGNHLIEAKKPELQFELPSCCKEMNMDTVGVMGASTHFVPSLNPYTTGPQEEANRRPPPLPPSLSGSVLAKGDGVKKSQDEDPLNWSTARNHGIRLRSSRTGDQIWVGHKNQIPKRMTYRIPPSRLGESMNDYYYRRLGEELEKDPSASRPTVSFAGQGAQSRAYFLHEKIPAYEKLVKEYPYEEVLIRQGVKVASGEQIRTLRKIFWVADHAKTVIKLRNPEPWKDTYQAKFNGDPTGYEKRVGTVAALHATRDIVLGEIFQTLSQAIVSPVTKKPIVVPVLLTSTEEEIKRGVFKQTAVRGESAWMIAHRIREARNGDEQQKKYLIKKMKFKDLDEALYKIHELEEFYRLTHKGIDEFQKKNGLQGVAATTASGQIVPVGFDYNHGTNVNWDPKDKVFKAFDF